MKIDQDSAQVRIPPPLILLACLTAGVILRAIHPVRFIPIQLRWSIAPILIAAGLAISIYCSRAFKKVGTDIKPWKPTSHLVTTGIYSFSRNPIYLAFVLVNLGVAFAMDNVWGLLMAIPLVYLVDRFAIVKEEKYLEGKFGDEYLEYKKRVRRWV